MNIKKLLIFIAAFIQVLVSVAIMGGIAYTTYHFVSKFW